MINSKDIADLRPDVASNARLWMADCQAQGLDVAVNSTRRDNEYQATLYAQGRTRPGNIVTNGKTTTFHGAGLALDFYSKSTGWSQHSFFVRCAQVAKKYGFSWSGDWKSFVEYAHIQWDNGGKAKHTNAPPMPLYRQEEIDMTEAEVKTLIESTLQKALNERDSVKKKAEDTLWPAAQSAWEKATKEGVLENVRPGAPAQRQELALILERIGALEKKV